MMELQQGDDVVGRKRAYRNLIPLVLDSMDSANSRRAYERQLIEFFDWYSETEPGPFSKASVQEYIRHMRMGHKTASTCNQALTVIRKLASEAVDNGLLTAEIAHGIDKIKGVKALGKRTGVWLTLKQAGQLIEQPDTITMKGKRDRVLLGLLLECGLRREEATGITIEQVQVLEGRTVLASVVGKGNRTRTIPVPAATARAIREWVRAAKIETGPLLRPVNKSERIEDAGISTASVYKSVRDYASRIGLEVRPHDLRRTFGRLSSNAGADIDQIKQTFGHSDRRTTEIYLGLEQDLRKGHAPCDQINLTKRKKGA